MSFGRMIMGIVVAALILFVWSGLTQMFPWGVPMANVLLSQAATNTELFQAPTVKIVPANTLTTPQFDREMVDKVNTLTTDQTFSWIITKPLAYYNPTAYLAREAVTQLIVGLLLVLLLVVTQALALSQRLLLVALAGLMAAVATYGQLYNWWGLTLMYAVGVSLNLIVGWLLTALVVGPLLRPRKMSNVS